MTISDGFVSFEIYDKRDDLDFDIVNLPFLYGDIPRAPSYGVYISKLIRFAGVSSYAAEFKKVNRNVEGVPQSQTAANPRHQKEEKNDKNQHVQNKQTNAREAHRLAPSTPSEVITMLKRTKKHKDKEHGNTLKHEAPRSINHKATQNKNNTETTALERSVA